jgi:hypothetical protein
MEKQEKVEQTVRRDSIGSEEGSNYPIEKEYIRPRMDYLKDYEINIRFLSLGCVVRVGCREVAFSSSEEAMFEVNAYVANPRELEKKYNKLFNEQK